MAKLIKTWEDLVGLETDEYYLDINLDRYNGSIRRKLDNEFMEYLSTHTFYGKQYQCSTILLQEYGFDVQLENWDGKTEEVNYRDQWLWSGKCELCRKSGYCGEKCKAAKNRRVNN